MANGSWEFDTANKYITGRVVYSSSSNGSSANSSTVKVTLQYKKSTSSTSSTYGNGNFYIIIAGSRKNFSGRYTFSCNNTYQTIGSYSYTVKHNNDGSGSCKISAGGGIPSTSFSSSSTSKTVTLSKIPRYATIKSFASSSIQQTAVTFKWTSDATCSEVWGYIGNTSKYHATISASSGSFTIDKLSPNTSYSFTLWIRRKDSGLDTKKTIKVKTLPIATISSSIDFNIGENLNISFSNYDKNASYLKLCVLNDDNVWENDISITSVDKDVASYVWELSSIKDLLYSKCTTRNSTSIKIICGVTLNEVNYENVTQGTISVLDSDPLFSNFSYKNTTQSISSVLNDDQYMISGFGNFQIIIPLTDKALGVNHATIKQYVATITSLNFKENKAVPYSFENDILIDFGAFKNSGEYKIEIYAVDSRGNTSDIIIKSFTVLKYSQPSINPVVTRLNNFEKEITLAITGYYSKLTLNDTIKNTEITIKYRKISHNIETYSDYKELDYTIKDQPNTDNYMVSKVINSEPWFDIIPSNEMWDYEFIIEDKITQSTPVIVTVEQGVPLASLVDDGKFLIGTTLNEAEENDSESLLHVNSDINAVDSLGNHIRVLEKIDNLIIYSDIEPLNQHNGGYWIKSTPIE